MSETKNKSRVPTDPADQLPLTLEPAPVKAVSMRDPFPDHQVSTLCRSTKKDNPKAFCPVCKHVHGMPAIQLDYVGHAAITDRLLDVDPAWSWEPLATGTDGSPLIDKDGGMWIRLTVGGVTRLGYGDAPNKTGGDAMKERIGDAIRNAAMRFGAALELWHKGELHLPDADHEDSAPAAAKESEMMPHSTAAAAGAAAPVNPAPENDPPAEPGEVAFITTKLKLLKTDSPAEILQAAGVPVTWDATKSVLVGALSKTSFATVKAALKGKK